MEHMWIIEMYTSLLMNLWMGATMHARCDTEVGDLWTALRVCGDWLRVGTLPYSAYPLAHTGCPISLQLNCKPQAQVFSQAPTRPLQGWCWAGLLCSSFYAFTKMKSVFCKTWLVYSCHGNSIFIRESHLDIYTSLLLNLRMGATRSPRCACSGEYWRYGELVITASHKC